MPMVRAHRLRNVDVTPPGFMNSGSSPIIRRVALHSVHSVPMSASSSFLNRATAQVPGRQFKGAFTFVWSTSLHATRCSRDVSKSWVDPQGSVVYVCGQPRSPRSVQCVMSLLRACIPTPRTDEEAAGCKAVCTYPSSIATSSCGAPPRILGAETMTLRSRQLGFESWGAGCLVLYTIQNVTACPSGFQQSNGLLKRGAVRAAVCCTTGQVLGNELLLERISGEQ